MQFNLRNTIVVCSNGQYRLWVQFLQGILNNLLIIGYVIAKKKVNFDVATKKAIFLLKVVLTLGDIKRHLVDKSGKLQRLVCQFLHD